MHYDYLVVGTGLFGSVFASEMKKKKKSCLMLEKRNHIGGNVYMKRLLALMFINMVRIFFIPPIGKYGIMLTSLCGLIIM